MTENEKAMMEEIAEVKKEGYNAYQNGLKRDEYPYHLDILVDAWIEGWDDAAWDD